MDLIGVIPTGKVWGLILRDVITEVCSAFQQAEKQISMDILVERPCAIPTLAYDVNLGKYRVEGFFLKGFDIKTDIERVHDMTIDKVLMLTDVDLCDPPHMNGFGYADMVHLFAIVSIFRLQKGANKFVLKERLVKESLHELGHVYGLDHCSNTTCPMSKSTSVFEIDAKSKQFCPRCVAMLSDSGYGEYWGV
jgi:archaemetzincin